MESIRNLTEQALPTALNATAFEPDCATCNDLRFEFVPGKGARPCPVCSLDAQKKRLLARIEDEYQMFSLATLEPMTARHWKQEAVLRQLRKEPERSYAFFGLNGVGKTLFGWLLYRYAVEKGRYAIGIKLTRLLDQYREQEFDESVIPEISPTTLLQAKSRYLVFLDDITVAPTSQYAGRKFYDLMDAIKTKGHQLVVTAHAPVEEIERIWNASGYNMGAAIVRRILQSDEMCRINDLFKEKK